MSAGGAMSTEKDRWVAPANTGARDPLMMGDSVGYEGGKNAATLGPMLEFSGKRYWLITYSLLFGSGTESPASIGTKLVHPAPVDCRPGSKPRTIGVLKHCSGYSTDGTTRPSRSLKEFYTGIPDPRVTTDWALCEVHDSISVAPNRMRYAPAEREFQECSGPVVKFFERNPRLRIVRASGRTSGIRYGAVCEVPAGVTHSGTKTREWYIENIGSIEGVKTIPGLQSKKEWNHGGIGIPGDGGACVVDDETRELVGMVWERSLHSGKTAIQRVAFFTSIHDILDDIYEKYPELGPASLPQDHNPFDFEDNTGDLDSAGDNDLGLFANHAGEIDFSKPLRITSRIDEQSHPDPSSNNLEEVADIVSNAKDHGPEYELFTETKTLDSDASTFQDQQKALSDSGSEQDDEYRWERTSGEEIPAHQPEYRAEDVLKVDDTSDSGYGSQSSVQGDEVRAFREEITDLFVNETELVDLFSHGLRPDGIGAERMVEEFRNALTHMGQSLQGDSDTLEQRACARRITRDTRYIADSVRKRCDADFEAAERLAVDKTPFSKEDQHQYILRLLQRTRPGQEQAAQQQAQVGGPETVEFDEEEQNDLDVEHTLSLRIEELKEFVVKSEHMTTLKERLREVSRYVHIPEQNSGNTIKPLDLDTPPRLSDNPEHRTKGLSLPRIVDRWLPQWLDSLWESRVPPEAHRFRWTCACGKRLYDDFYDLQPTQVDYLEAILHRNNHQSTAGSPSTGWVGLCTKWSASMIAAAGSAFQRSQNSDNVIPLHNLETGRPPTTTQANMSVRNDRLFLLFCVQIGKEGFGRVLHHADVETPKLKNDNDLFKFLGESYERRRQLRSRLSLRTVTEVGNCKIYVDLSNFVSELYRHSQACLSNSNAGSGCQCWPPAEETGYRYIAQKSTESFMMGKNYLLHHFHNPGCLDPRQRSVLCFVPMKKDTQLEGAAGCPMPGWGVYFEEGWDVKTICVVVTVLLVVISLVLGVTWWRVESDFSGGWGVASFCVTAATLVVTVLVILGKQSY